MNRMEPIYTEKTQCQDCYKCVRECPVKAIKVVDGSAMVIPEACILCGHCTEVCPVHAKKIRDDLDEAKALLERVKKKHPEVEVLQQTNPATLVERMIADPNVQQRRL